MDSKTNTFQAYAQAVLRVLEINLAKSEWFVPDVA
jgi:hypothetical protein